MVQASCFQKHKLLCLFRSRQCQLRSVQSCCQSRQFHGQIADMVNRHWTSFQCCFHGLVATAPAAATTAKQQRIYWAAARKRQAISDSVARLCACCIAVCACLEQNPCFPRCSGRMASNARTVLPARIQQLGSARPNGGILRVHWA